MSDFNCVKVKFVREGATLPEKASDGAAAYDLRAFPDNSITLHPGEFLAIPTGIAIELPSSRYAALVLARSGLGIKKGIDLVNSVGLIDSDYRGEIAVGLINHSAEDFIICSGDRIAQLLIIELPPLPLLAADSLGDTARGAGGFGSTGVR